MLPSIWRIELLHPVTVHFPIALLIFGSAFYILSCLLYRFDFSSKLKFSGFILILIGTIAAWIANYTGGLAEEVVALSLCNPEIRILHEDYAYYTAYLFTAFVALEILRQRFSNKLSVTLLILNILLLLGGVGLLGYVGHLGADLVYQQGAGVYAPGPECKGY